MKAAVHYRYGAPEVLQIAEIPTPVPAANEVLIRVSYATVNRTDTGFRTAEYFISRFFSGLFRPKNPVLGCEFSGVVESAGNAVTRFKPGDRVYGFNDSRFGAHAEYVCLPEDAALGIVPEALTLRTAACITEGGHYALCNLRAAAIAPGQRWLIQGCTGAIGSAAVQLAKHFGAEVTAVTFERYAEIVRTFQPDHLILHEQQDFTLNGETYDVVFDAVGKSTFGKCKRILKPGGVYMSTELGPGGQNPFLAIWGKIKGGTRVLFPIPITTREDIELLGALAAEGKFTPLIDREYTLDQIVEAHAYVQSGQKLGNVLVAL
jgi:NADPH:quinone reductase-like Zn-dependent oxidoreductase